METVSSPSPPKSRNSIVLIFLIFILNVSSTTSIASNFPELPYSKYCNDVVQESPSTNIKVTRQVRIQLSNAFFSGGYKNLGKQNRQFDSDVGKSVSFRTRHVYTTAASGVFKLYGVITFRGFEISKLNFTRRGLRLVNYRPPRIPVRRKEAAFILTGYWSAESGKLCMVGSGLYFLKDVNVVLKLNYPNSSTILTSLVNGTMESLDKDSALTYFEPVSILGVSSMGYNYTMIDRENEKGSFSSYDKMENVSSGLRRGLQICMLIRSAGRVELEYTNECDSVNCNPLGRLSGNLPIFLTFSEIEDCKSDDRARYLLEFSNSGKGGGGVQSSFDPNTTLVAEGAWNEKKKRLDLVGCHILNITNSLSGALVDDCSIRLSLSLPAAITLRSRSTIIGQIWSNKSRNDSSYFGRVSFKSTGNENPRVAGILKYEYTEIENVKKHCAKRLAGKGKRGKYPSGYSPDMRFDMIVKDRKRKVTWGYSSPLSVNDKFYQLIPMFEVKPIKENMFNVSYVMNFQTNSGFKLGSGFSSAKVVEISTEGIYNAKNGLLCMIGCRKQNRSSDCEVLVNAQYPQIGAAGGTIKGSLESTRNKTDPMYFDKIEFSSSSIYTSQAQETIWRMDLEITMVLVSNTLACIFIGLQLLHVKKKPDSLPFISIIMLVVLTLAHMIPLLLNFEAMFMSNSIRRQNVFLGSDGWLEINEVLVRVITMIAFLLQFLLLQLSWSSRNSDDSHKTLWFSDKKALYMTLPIYILGGLIAWFVRLLSKSNHIPELQRRQNIGYNLWGESKSYAGLILDGFLLPQIIFNLFANSKDSVLAPSYYIGMSFIRLLPHVYDLYRGHSSTTTWLFNYIYANPRMDYYSTAWDIVISCGGLLFVFLIFLQQRFGGRCFLPKRFRNSSSNPLYEKVPVISTE